MGPIFQHNCEKTWWAVDVLFRDPRRKRFLDPLGQGEEARDANLAAQSRRLDASLAAHSRPRRRARATKEVTKYSMAGGESRSV